MEVISYEIENGLKFEELAGGAVGFLLAEVQTEVEVELAEEVLEADTLALIVVEIELRAGTGEEASVVPDDAHAAYLIAGEIAEVGGLDGLLVLGGLVRTPVIAYTHQGRGTEGPVGGEDPVVGIATIE